MFKAITSRLRLGTLAALVSLLSAPALAKGGEVIHVSQAHWDKIDSVAFSPDGKYAVSGDYGGEVIVWKVEDGSRHFSTKWGGGSVVGLSFSPDSKDLFVAKQGDNGTLARYSIKSGKRKDDRGIGRDGLPLSMAISPDGKLLLLGLLSSNDAIIVKSKNFKLERRLIGHGDVITAAQFGPDGKSIITAALDGSLVVWTVKDGTRKFQIKADPGHAFRDVTFSVDGTKIAYSQRGEVNIANAKTGKLVQEDLGRSSIDNETYGNIEKIAYHPDGHLIAAGSSNGTIFLWDAVSGELLGELSGEHEEEISGLAFSDDGSMLISGGYDNRVVIWRLD